MFDDDGDGVNDDGVAGNQDPDGGTLPAPPGGWAPASRAPPPPADDGGECTLPLCPVWFVPLVILAVLLPCLLLACVMRRRARARRRGEGRDAEQALGDGLLDGDEEMHSMNPLNMGAQDFPVYDGAPLGTGDRDDRVASVYMDNPLADITRRSVAVDDHLLSQDGWRTFVGEDGEDFFVHDATGAETREMPLEVQRNRLQAQRECAERLRIALQGALQGLDGASEDGTQLAQARVELEADLATIEAACEVSSTPVDASALQATLARAEVNLCHLEELVGAIYESGESGGGGDPEQGNATRSGGSLWRAARAGVGVGNNAGGGDSWSLILQHIQRIRAQLKPVAKAMDESQIVEGGADAWVRSLRSKLRPVADRHASMG